MPEYSSSNLRVVVHRPLSRLLFGLCLFAVVIATLAGGYYVGRELSAMDTTYVSSLETIKAADEARVAQLKRDLIDARLAYEVDSQALNALRLDLEQTRTQMAKLREEVTFYRSLMAPNSNAKGLQIAAFETLPLASGANSYHLLLTQVASRRVWLAGEVKIEISGDTETGPQVLSLTELASIPEYPLKFRFRYFQDLRGELRMPKGFNPRQVEVTVERRGKKPLSRTFPWSADV
ncbi:MAG: DUF6776 family protein [Pseudomonadales bacterium]